MTDSVVGLHPGSVIQNTYEIISLLGEGGMGATFKGKNLATDHLVAIKVVTPEFARNARALELFKRESSLLRTVQSNAVIRYETTIQDAENRLFLIMEYVDGKPLIDYIKRGARLASLDVMKLGRQLAGGLEAIHKLNIVHRDIAPDNILVPDDDILNSKLIDFGLASNTVGTDKSILGDSIAGKFSFMAPEQMGMFDGKVQPATDIYGLGLVLMQVAGLKVPGAGMGPGALAKRTTDIEISAEDISPALANMLSQMLKADPAERPVNLLAVIDDAIAAEQSGATRPPAPPTPKPTQPGVKKSALPLVAVGIAALALIGAAAFLMIPQDIAPSSEKTVEDAKDVLQQDDPISKATALLRSGSEDSFETGLTALMALGNNEAEPDELRARALVEVAKLYDPETFESALSPNLKSSAAFARRFYSMAAELGSTAAQTALTRLE